MIKRRLRAPFFLRVRVATEWSDENRRAMPLRPRELSGRHRSGADIDLSLHGLPDADRIALSGDGDLRRRTRPHDGADAKDLRQDRRQRPDAFSAFLRTMRCTLGYQT